MSTQHLQLTMVLRTGRPIELDWACDALTEAGIPFHRREESSGGLCVAMPLTPTPAPGVWWSVLVAETDAQAAREILDQLPIEKGTNPDVWSFRPKRSGELAWKTYCWIFLVITALLGLQRVIATWRDLTP